LKIDQWIFIFIFIVITLITPLNGKWYFFVESKKFIETCMSYWWLSFESKLESFS
jgi:hypothetical protein